MYVSIGQAAQLIGVSISTLRRWEKERSLTADFRTIGGHRSYYVQRLKDEILELPEDEAKSASGRKTVIEIMTVFTAKMHGKRSHRNKKECAA